MYKKTGGGFVFLAILLAGCLYVLADAFTEDPPSAEPDQPATETSFFNKGYFKLPLGIDLRGGTELLYELDLSKVDPSTKQNIANDVKEVMQARLDQYGTSERSISVIGNDSLLVELPGADPEETARVQTAIEKSGQLSFNLVAVQQSPARVEAIEARMLAHDAAYEAWVMDQEAPAAERQGLTKPQDLPEVVVVTKQQKDGPPPTKLIVDKATEVSGKWLTGAYRTLDQKQFPAIGFEFSSVGRTQFADLTGDNVGKRLAIVLDGVAISTANIRSRILGPGILEGVEDSEIKTVVPILKAGSLPAKPNLVNKTTIGSVLGRDSIAQGEAALAVSFLIVIVFMASFYLVPGLVANVALILNLVILLSFMIVFRNTLTFPGMAGLLLTVGMAVDANILIFERIREEKSKGKSLNQAVQSGFQRAFWTIFDANLTTLITAFVLFQLGTGPVKGFAVVLSLGIVCSFFTSLFVSRLILSVLMKSGVVTELKMLSLLKDPNIDFLKFRKPALAMSLGVIVLGLGVFVVRGGENLGIDFTGGARMVINLKAPAPEAEIRSAIASIEEAGQLLFDDVQVQAVGEAAAGGVSSFSIRTQTSDKQLKAILGPQQASAQAPGESEPTEQVQFQTLFQDKVGEQLRHLLAPAGYTPATLTDGGNGQQVIAQVWRLKKEDGVTATEVLAHLQKKSFPVKSGGVEPVSDGASLGQNYVAFRITTDPVPLSDVIKVKSQLVSAMSDSTAFSISNPFSRVDSIGGKVAGDLQTQVFIAMFVAILAIIFYVSLRFQFKFGLASIVALVHDILFVTAFMALCDLAFGNFMSLKINLPMVAALLTVVGYSLNDTIVIFDRIRENIVGKKRGFDLPKAVNTSINQTLNRTILTSLTTFLVVFILLIWGGESIQSFTFALCVGVVIGTYSSIFIASPALIHFNERSERRREALIREAGGK